MTCLGVLHQTTEKAKSHDGMPDVKPDKIALTRKEERFHFQEQRWRLHPVFGVETRRLRIPEDRPTTYRCIQACSL